MSGYQNRDIDSFDDETMDVCTRQKTGQKGREKKRGCKPDGKDANANANANANAE
jgi:hypothetical protein